MFYHFGWQSAVMSAAVFLAAAAAAGQSTIERPEDALDAVRAEMRELRQSVAGMRDQLDTAQREIRSLRQQLAAVRGEPAPASAAALAKLDSKVTALAEDEQAMEGKFNDHDQTKVASGSRYRVRLSGLALLNAAATHGAVDNLDLAAIAHPRAPGESAGSFGATLRQSVVKLGVDGPTVAGARTSGDLNFDFFGGFPSTAEGVTSGLMRLRTAKLALDWSDTSVVAGQEAPFFSPLSPSSLVSMAYPALSYSGNLWTWTPQVYVERRFALGDASRLALQAGVLDPLTGELPSEYNRTPTAGERSRVPAYALRIGWHGEWRDRPAGFGFGSYFSKQNWSFGRSVNAWAATSDWDLPLGAWLALSGELYRGRAIGGLGGGVLEGPAAEAARHSTGGWSQLKFKPWTKLEFNTAFGKDDSFAIRNSTGMANFIYQPRSNLLFSVEYHRIWTSRAIEGISRAGQVNVGAGILF